MASRLPVAIHYRLAHARVLTYAVVVTLLMLLALWGACLWHWRNNAFVLWWGLGFLLAYAWLCSATWRWLQTLPIGWLVWTGVHWRIQVISSQHDVPAYAHCACVLDVQTALLLRLSGCTHKSPVPQTRWVWVQAVDLPKHWCALRAVVYAQSGTKAS